MAAALADKIIGDACPDIRIESAGIYADNGMEASEGAKEALKDYGIDLSYHRSQPLTKDLVDQCDLILTMTKSQKSALLPIAGDKVYTLSEYAGFDTDVSDPYGGSTEVYKETAKQLYGLIEAVVEKLKNND